MNRRTQQQPLRERASAGFSLLYVVVVVSLLSTLTAGVLSITSSGVSTESVQNYADRARYLANSGLEYLRMLDEQYRAMDGKTLVVDAAKGEYIEYGTVRQTANQMISATVTGTAAQGTAHEANYTLTKQFSPANRGAIQFSDSEDFANFNTIVSDPSKDPIVKGDDFFVIGDNENYAFGAMYYMGDKQLNWGYNNCTDGECDFKIGFRLFFTFQYESNAADGIVFTWFNADNNTNLSIGGSSDLGEFMGYAGDGRVYKGTNGNWSNDNGGISKWVDPERDGVQPPKMGIEFDNYGNNGADAICNGDYAYRVGARKDPGGGGTSGTDHVSYMFWGTTNQYNCAMKYNSSDYYRTSSTVTATADGSRTWDDNRHGEGDTSNGRAVNLGTNEGWNLPGSSPSNWGWTSDKMYAFRAEVVRGNATNANGTYGYTIRSWMRRCANPGNECYEYVHDDADNRVYFSDTSADLNATLNPPILNRYVELSPAYHTKFEKFIFGFQEATGGATQKATYHNFILQFRKPNDAYFPINKTVN